MPEHNCVNVERIVTVETEVKNIKSQISDLKDMKEALIVLTTLQEESAKRDIERDLDRKKQAEALIVLSETPKLIEKLDKKLDSQYETLQKHDKKITAIDTKLETQAVEKTNKTEITKGKMVLYGVIITASTSTIATIAVALITKLIK
jgi:hypothetical protein